uniref:Tetraspanin-17-like n=1 Tax=Camelus bactrianus TaxID=9837 RepID=A0A9W3G9H3_CAMBA|nr:tetraspanin-17-like [Camelus bactrianus]
MSSVLDNAGTPQVPRQHCPQLHTGSTWPWPPGRSRRVAVGSGRRHPGMLGLAGRAGALEEDTFLLKFFSMFLGRIVFLELAAGILAFVFKDWVGDQLNLFINKVKAYRDDLDLQNLTDFAQERWSCCAARGPVTGTSVSTSSVLT